MCLKLRSSMQQAAEDVAQKKIRVDHERYDVQQLIEARTASLTGKVSHLEAKIRRYIRLERHEHPVSDFDNVSSP